MKRVIASIILIAIFITCPQAEAAKKKSKRKSQPQTQTQSQASTHNYYRGLTKAQAEQADKVAREIAEYVKNKRELTTDRERVAMAARIVAGYCNRGVYGNDEQKFYRSPYGVFIAGIFTCAGATRALGRVLDFMGYDWEHVNENKWAHQWCVLKMDGVTGYADGQVGFVNYGTHPSAR